MLELKTPTSPIVVADAIRELTALQHLRFTQAWMRETGLATSGHAIQEHLGRHALFIRTGETVAAQTSLNNLIESLNAQEAGEPLLAAVLAPCVRKIGAVPFTDMTPAGLELTALAILATGIGQEVLQQTVYELKKNFSEN